MRTVKGLLFLVLMVATLIACSTQAPSSLDEENVGKVSQGLIAIGQRCLTDSQCSPGTDGQKHCVDTVCCKTTCGATVGFPRGAPDNLVCSDIYCGANNPSCYGAAQTNGTCFTVPVGQACGEIKTFTPCRWQGSNVNGGGNCPQPGGGTEFSCQSCGQTCGAGLPACPAGDSCINGKCGCPDGLPICSGTPGSCTACTADNGTLPAPVPDTRCPTADHPACIDSGCFECSATNSSACGVGANINKGSCDPTQHTCVGCTGNAGTGGAFPCGSALPACLVAPDPNAGRCVECTANPASLAPEPAGVAGGVACSDPTRPVCDLTTNTCVPCTLSNSCPSSNPVCTNKTCVKCNGNNGNAGATSRCPTTTKPACVPSPIGPGTCEVCSASDTTACPTTPSTTHKWVCDVTAGGGLSPQCVECNTDPQCADVPGKPFCNGHVCASGCQSSAQCSAPTPVCNAAGHCVACADHNNEDVPSLECASVAGKPYCKNEVCVECAANKIPTECPVLTAPVCSTAGVCVKCDGNRGGNSNNPCPTAALPACNMATGQCLECNNNSQCSGQKPLCNLSTNKCVQCTTNLNCNLTPNTPVCNTSSGLCAACNAENGAPGSPPTVLACPLSTSPACLGGPCAECKDNANPPPAGGTNTVACQFGTVCKDASKTCVECLTNAQCLGTNGICNLQSNTCTAGCSSDANCVTFPDTPRCNMTTMQCVQCLTGTDCSGSTPQCDVGTNTCVECLNDTQCGDPKKPRCVGGSCTPCNGNLGSGASAACLDAAAPACVTSGPDAGKCVECTQGSNSLCVAPKPACNDTSHKCVQCATNAQCSGATPICNSAGTCVACDGDLNSGSPSACFTQAKPACAKTGTKQGQCVECLTSNTTACTAGKPVCNVTNDADVCVECNSNAECTGPKGICNLALHECTVGCSSNANCPASDPVCKLPDGICVECIAGSTAKCVDPTPLCDEPTNKCVACLTTAQCPADQPVCNPQTHTCTAECTKHEECPASTPVCNPQTKRCVECTSNAECTPPLICNTTTNKCGTDCSKSEECPGSTPVCDPQTKVCVECTDNTQCKDPKPICNRATGTCGTDCTKSSDCTGGTPVCNPSTKKCVQCTTNTDCPAATPVCNPQTGTCGPNTDAGTPIDYDNSIPVDDYIIQGAGCGCKTVPAQSNTTPVLLGLGLGLTVVARRRRR